MTEIAIRPATSQALSLGATMTTHDAWRFAEALAGSGMLPRQYQNNPASVLWALEYGRSIGLDVITTTQSIHVIQGRATASADLMASLTRRAGHRMRITGDDERAEVVIIRADDQGFEFRAVWDIAKATRAKLLNKDTWKQFPGAMLRARAISECVRMACPEVLHGTIYTPEELGASVDADGAPVAEQAGPAQRATQAPVSQWETPTPAADSPPMGSDLLANALAATNAEAVRELYRRAAAINAPQEILAQLAEVGRRLAEQSASAAQESPAEPEPDVVDAEVVPDPEPEQPPADDGGKALTDAQKRKLGAVFGEAGVKDKEGRLNFTSVLLGRAVQSWNDLTRREAAYLIDVFERALSTDDPGGAIADAMAAARERQSTAA